MCVQIPFLRTIINEERKDILQESSFLWFLIATGFKVRSFNLVSFPAICVPVTAQGVQLPIKNDDVLRENVHFVLK